MVGNAELFGDDARHHRRGAKTGEKALGNRATVENVAQEPPIQRS
jgi:hypothetical protein